MDRQLGTFQSIRDTLLGCATSESHYETIEWHVDELDEISRENTGVRISHSPHKHLYISDNNLCTLIYLQYE